MKQLKVFQVEGADHLVSPSEFSDIDEQSPALSIFTDFRLHQPHTVATDMPAVEAARLMHRQQVDSKLVVNAQGELVGLIPIERLSEQHLLVEQTVQKVDRKELLVSDMMRPRGALPAVDYEDLKHSTVGDLVRTLRLQSESYCLVLDRGQHHIRGLISLKDLAERLHQPVIVERRPSIVNLFSI